MSPQLRERIKGRFQAVLEPCTVLAWGSADLCGMLANAPSVREAFPQLLSSSDLELLLAKIADKSHSQRSRAYLESAGELAQTFVPTSAYREALQLLTQHHFVMLSGPPEVGKTTIARIIGLMKVQEGWQCYECRRPSDFFQLRERDQRQVFIVDDAFGATEYRPELAHTWSDDLDGVMRSLGPECWVLWTSRSAPLEQALKRMNLQGKAEKFPSPSNVTVDASVLSLEERALILYRHAKQALLPEQPKRSFKSLALGAVENKHFTPLRVRRWTLRLKECQWTEDASKNTALIDKSFQEEFLAPSEIMRKSFLLQPATQQLVLISLLDTHDSIMEEEGIINAFLRLFPEATGDVKQCLTEFEGHFLRAYVGHSMQVDGECIDLRGYKWTHPNWRDLLIDWLGTNMSMRRQFLSRCGVSGAELALSGAGGAAGKRDHPLLQQPGDWRALTEGCARFIQQEPDSTQHFLEALLDALSRHPRSVQSQERLDLSRTALTACRALWNDHPELLTVKLLQRYYQISEFLTPLPESPSLHAYWQRVTDALAQALDAEKFPRVRQCLTEWALLIGLLSSNEPRFLRQVDFSENSQDLLDELSSHLEAESRSWVDDHDLSRLPSHLQEAKSVKRLIQKLIASSLKIGAELDPVDSMLNDRIRILEKKQKAVPRAEARNREDDGHPWAKHSASESFNIRDFFTDL